MATAETSIFPSAEDLPLLLGFTAGGESFAIDILAVRGVIGVDELTPAVAMPGHVRGTVLNVDFVAVPVIDLSSHFGLGQTPIGRRTSCVILAAAKIDGERIDVGMLVDAVDEVLDLRLGRTEAPPDTGSNARDDATWGIGVVGERRITVLDVAKLLAHGDFAALRPPAAGRHASAKAA